MYHPELLAHVVLTAYAQIFSAAVAFEAVANHGGEFEGLTEKLLPS
jgi:hypothetical protein